MSFLLLLHQELDLGDVRRGIVIRGVMIRIEVQIDLPQRTGSAIPVAFQPEWFIL
jgi:hypothetical protein